MQMPTNWGEMTPERAAKVLHKVHGEEAALDVAEYKRDKHAAGEDEEGARWWQEVVLNLQAGGWG